jgi:transposase InsO family protein
MALSTVSAILKRLGLGRLRALEPRPAVQRYERARAGELLHVDTKRLARIRGVGHRIHGDRSRRVAGVGYEWAHVCIDDASRVAYVEMLPSERAEDAVGFLRRAVGWFRRQGVRVERVMTDNARAYDAHLHREACAELGLRHLRTRPYTPRTNGKAERLIQTLLREWAYARPFRSSNERRQALPGWLQHYNRRRPHWSLNLQTPMSRLEAVR